MIEVIRSSKQTVECNRCKSLLAYTHNDIQVGNNQFEYNLYIICPECGNKIELNTGRQVPFWERER